MNKNLKIVFAVSLVAVLAAGFFAGRLTAPEATSHTVEVGTADDCVIEEMRDGSAYEFINPLLECDNFHPSKLNSIVKLETEISNYVQQVLTEQKAVHVSVYFRDLNFGPWMGLNEETKFSPASLLKVPILIAALKKAEVDPKFLNKKVLYDRKRETEINQNIVDTGFIKLGRSYTIDDLIHRMIILSDNEAKELVVSNIDATTLNKVMSDIGIHTEGINPGDDFVSVKTYSSFFRLLYNATYLNRQMSQKALEILSQTHFPKGLTAGVPKGTTVSHKFGERAYYDSDIKQLHDCGIVYLPGSPYLLCVMTRGKDFDQLASIISGVSGVVYKNLSTVSNTSTLKQ